MNSFPPKYALLSILAVAVTMLASCGGSETTPIPSSPDNSSPASGESTDASPAPAPAPTPAPAAPTTPDLSGLPAPYNEASYKDGRKKFRLCQSCHLVTEGAPHRIGPNLYGVFDRKAGAAEGFRYSEVMKTAGFDWTPEKLDEWLANPGEFLPQNNMRFGGIPTETQRRDLIAYLLVETRK